MGAGTQNSCGGQLGLADHHETERGTGGELNASIARAVVRIYRGFCGRGPTKARATYPGSVVVVVVGQALTQGEGALVGGGRRGEALAMGRGRHGAMRDCFALVFGGLTRSRVR